MHRYYFNFLVETASDNLEYNSEYFNANSMAAAKNYAKIAVKDGIWTDKGTYILPGRIVAIRVVPA